MAALALQFDGLPSFVFNSLEKSDVQFGYFIYKQSFLKIYFITIYINIKM